MTARLYVGGLPPDISAADVIGRFTTFGKVSSCELVPSKGLQGAPGTCRGFAYVDLQPKDDHAVARCLSLYNGCKWRGHKLRVEVAKPNYLLKLQQEKQREAEEEAAAEEQRQQQLQQQQEEEQPGSPSSKEPLRIPVPGRKHKVVLVEPGVKAKGARNWFPPTKPTPLDVVCWDPPATPPHSMVYRLNDLELAGTWVQPTTEAATAAADGQPPGAARAAAAVGGPAKRGAAVPHQYTTVSNAKGGVGGAGGSSSGKGSGSGSGGAAGLYGREHVAQLRLIKQLVEFDRHLPSGPAAWEAEELPLEQPQQQEEAGERQQREEEEEEEEGAVLRPAAAAATQKGGAGEQLPGQQQGKASGSRAHAAAPAAAGVVDFMDEAEEEEGLAAGGGVTATGAQGQMSAELQQQLAKFDDSEDEEAGPVREDMLGGRRGPAAAPFAALLQPGRAAASPVAALGGPAHGAADGSSSPSLKRKREAPAPGTAPVVAAMQQAPAPGKQAKQHKDAPHSSPAVAAAADKQFLVPVGPRHTAVPVQPVRKQQQQQQQQQQQEQQQQDDWRNTPAAAGLDRFGSDSEEEFKDVDEEEEREQQQQQQEEEEEEPPPPLQQSKRVKQSQAPQLGSLPSQVQQQAGHKQQQKQQQQEGGVRREGATLGLRPQRQQDPVVTASGELSTEEQANSSDADQGAAEQATQRAQQEEKKAVRTPGVGHALPGVAGAAAQSRAAVAAAATAAAAGGRQAPQSAFSFNFAVQGAAVGRQQQEEVAPGAVRHAVRGSKAASAAPSSPGTDRSRPPQDTSPAGEGMVGAAATATPAAAGPAPAGAAAAAAKSRQRLLPWSGSAFMAGKRKSLGAAFVRPASAQQLQAEFRARQQLLGVQGSGSKKRHGNR